MWGDDGIEPAIYEDELEFDFLDRMLGGNETDYSSEGYIEAGAVPLFYKVLKYGIFTLYLILFVEFARHTIDSAARGRPFFTAVLKMVYSELATLGIVEFGVFLWGKYGTIDKDVKKKFADVHFALFLTAIFNALQYSLASVVSTRFSNALWVKTEQLQLDHYVEIREEFDRVQEIIGSQYAECGKWIRNAVLFVCRPGLRQRHESLRVQVRFHELRLHFLESNNLSFSLKVSDYLKRSELAILIGLVHVSVTTWVLLIGLLNIGYFVFGIIGYTLQNPGYIAVVIAVLFFVVDISFILLSWALRWKMHKIFQTVMKTQVIDTSDREEGIKNQNQLFWFGSPRLVISMIQLMNFGYAVSISIVIIYWEYLNKHPGLSAEAYLIASLGCYSIFLYSLSALLPEYTLCTSLGYLTNQKELAETVAMHRLELAEQQRRKRVIENATKSDPTIVEACSVHEADMTEENAGTSSLLVSSPPRLMISRADASTDDMNKKAPLLVSDLVKVNTTDLRSNLPKASREMLVSREERIRQRRANRRKSVSDGVAAMRAWNQESATTTSKQTQENSARKHNRRTRIRKTTSQPGVIQAWQNITASGQGGVMVDSKDGAGRGIARTRRRSSSDPRTIQVWKESLAEEEQGVTSTENNFSPTGELSVDSNKERDDDWKSARLQRLAARKRARKKTQSASAIIQSWQDYSIQESTTGKDGAISDENYNSSDLRGLSSDDGSDENTHTPKITTNRFYGSMNKHGDQILKRQPDLHTLREVESPKADTKTITDKSVVIDLSNAVIVHDEKHIDDDTNTIDTDKSIGNLSDIDVIQAEKVGMFFDPNTNNSTTEVDLSLYATFIQKVRQYFVSSTYHNTSHVLGTSIVFCLIGSRVEVMLKLSYDEYNPLPKVKLFWAEAIILSWFLFTDFLILVFFTTSKATTKTERRLNLEAVIDILITGPVLALFFFAEAKRCCIAETEGAQSGNLPGGYDEMGDEYSFYSECTCERWGARTFGGLGMIEPFTSLIFLRLFRFKIANYLVDHVKSHSYDSKSMEQSQLPPNGNHHGGRLSDDHDSGHESKRGSALELWERAIADFPDIVQKHGEFSGELLQAMLGLDVTIDIPRVPVILDSGALVKKTNVVPDPIKAESAASHIKLTQSRYAKLPPKAQGIVIAGSLRKPVKPVCTEAVFDPSSSSPQMTGLVDFEIDNDRMHSEQHTSYSFIAPFAKLVRSMRRCDRRHLPLLKGWQSVDVVMTQFEIVYFEAIDSYYSELDDETKSHCEACRLALNATKGGKNLRLCDVALGRKVVGHLDLADITEVHVTKDDVPVSDMTLIDRAAVMFKKEDDPDVEHWSNPYQETEAKKKYARIIRWTLIQEERLKISTTSNTTYFFRFYSDLAYFEADTSGEQPSKSDGITRDIAFQWAETISRICGRTQLEQSLPHFGEENEDELRDYLEVVHFHEKEAENQKKGILRGAGNFERLFVHTEEKKPKHKRIKSMIDISSDSLKFNLKSTKSSIDLSNMTQPPQKKRLGRSLSVGYHSQSVDNLV